jgi:hypothetical protein
MQILNNGLFAQDVLYNAGESVIFHTVTDFVAKKCFNKKVTPLKQNHKSHKQRHHTLKHTSIKYISFSNYTIPQFTTAIVKNNFAYSLHLSTFQKDIIPPPPKA